MDSASRWKEGEGFPALSKRALRRRRREESSFAGSSTTSVSPSLSTDDAPLSKRSPANVAERLADIPTTATLLNPFLQETLRTIWEQGGTRQAAAPPPFKVGTREMYRRFSEGYEAFMRHHDCTLVEEYLHRVLDRLAEMERGNESPRASEVAAAPSDSGCLRVLDLGCGTGRVGEMLTRHSAVHTLCAYDKEPNMLPRCLINTVAAAAGAAGGDQKRRQAVHMFSTAPLLHVANSLGSAEWSSAPCFVLEGKHNWPGDAKVLPPLQLCVRPVSFEDIQDGFLSSSTAVSPLFHLIVCAWSFSYIQRQQWGGDKWHATVDRVLQQLWDRLDSSPSHTKNRSNGAEVLSGGVSATHEGSVALSPNLGPSDTMAKPRSAIVIIETLGHSVEAPTRQSTLPQRLEEVWGFERTWVRTDYHFESPEQAETYTHFFFGKEVSQRMKSSKSKVLPECTGIWTKWKY